MLGSMLGGLGGSLARLIQVHPDVDVNKLSYSAVIGGITSTLLAMILSVVAVIFMARKSDAQSFVTVEDFWGGALIGFFVGYTGTSFFTELTKLAPPTAPPTTVVAPLPGG
jgi:hypothetical protein